MRKLVLCAIFMVQCIVAFAQSSSNKEPVMGQNGAFDF